MLCRLPPILFQMPTASGNWYSIVQWLEKECTAEEDAGEAFRSPDDNYLSEPDNVSPQAWEQLLVTLNRWIQTGEFHLHFIRRNLDRPYAPADGKYTWYAVIHGLMHHDNYHFGQIIMLKKCSHERVLHRCFTDHVFGGNTAAVVPCRNG